MNGIIDLEYEINQLLNVVAPTTEENKDAIADETSSGQDG